MTEMSSLVWGKEFITGNCSHAMLSETINRYVIFRLSGYLNVMYDSAHSWHERQKKENYPL